MSPLRCPGQDSRFFKSEDIAELACPRCGKPVEFWPDELVRKCQACGYRFANPENSLKCLQWCPYAAQCMEAMGGESGIAPLREELIERMKKTFGEDTARISHALAVLDLAERIGMMVGAMPMVLVPAAILHDIGLSALQPGEDQESHGRKGRRIATGTLADMGFPEAVEREILDLIERHHEREWMNTANGAALFDADLAVNLAAGADADRWAALEREALTEAGRQTGAAYLGRRPSGER
ncbi:MAG: HD domain-containing protein [Planctomycetes bacterium]|nr:HD domain-containing protein [Planctomycetota bacterium]